MQSIRDNGQPQERKEGLVVLKEFQSHVLGRYKHRNMLAVVQWQDAFTHELCQRSGLSRSTASDHNGKRTVEWLGPPLLGTPRSVKCGLEYVSELGLDVKSSPVRFSLSLRSDLCHRIPCTCVRHGYQCRRKSHMVQSRLLPAL